MLAVEAGQSRYNRAMKTECTGVRLGTIKTLISVQYILNSVH